MVERHVRASEVVVFLCISRVHMEGWVMAVLMCLELLHPAGSLFVVGGMMRLEERISLAVEITVLSCDLVVGITDWVVSRVSVHDMSVNIAMVILDKVTIVRDHGVDLSQIGLMVV